MKIIYGPVQSWRLGRSLAVDPISRHPKVCNFNCGYCRFGNGGIILLDRVNFLDEDAFIEEVRENIDKDDCDVVKFKGTGESFLAANVGQMARRIKDVSNKRTAIITNSSMFGRDDVRKDLEHFDVIIAKLDAATEETFRLINRPHSSITLQGVLDGIRLIKSEYKGSLRIHITLVKENLEEAEMIARFCQEICPDTVYVQLPDKVEGLHQVSRKDLQTFMELFAGLKCPCSSP